MIKYIAFYTANSYFSDEYEYEASSIEASYVLATVKLQQLKNTYPNVTELHIAGIMELKYHMEYYA